MTLLIESRDNLQKKCDHFENLYAEIGQKFKHYKQKVSEQLENYEKRFNDIHVRAAALEKENDDVCAFFYCV